MGQYFGTDGVRGRAGEGKLSADRLAELGAALATFVGEGGSVAIGRDTRLSGPDIFDTLARGLRRGGVNVRDLGILPTPGTALMTSELGARLGAMITASHNPWHDNGVKLFGPDGRKLPDADQDRIEALIGEPGMEGRTPGEVLTVSDAAERYIEHVVKAVGPEALKGLRVVADAANGAAGRVLPAVLERLGAVVDQIGTETDGRFINDGVGSNNPATLAARVLETGADAGVAVDGDADRIVLVDSRGRIADGDQIIGRLATQMSSRGSLRGGTVVATVMSNLGLERHVEALGLAFERTKVGDRHVAKRMAEIGANLGGEASGHILLTDHARTGDGTLTAALVLAGLRESGLGSEAYFHAFDPVPQTLVNVRYDGPSPLQNAQVADAIAAEQDALAGQGRILVRASGTEPLIRIMVEGDDAALVTATAEKMRAVVEGAAQQG